MAEITMPQLGETVTEGTVTRWLKKVGDKVAQDEVLFEVSTDKVDSEVPSAASGYLAEIIVGEGETVDVGARLAVISDDPPSGDGGGASGGQAEPTSQSQPAAEVPEAKADSVPLGAPQPQQPQPGAPEVAEVPPTAGSASPTAGIVLSPVVRRLIAEHGIDPSNINGSGSGGRITRADVLAYVDTHSRAKASVGQPGAIASSKSQVATPSGPAPATRAVQPVPPARGQAQGGERDEVVPFNNIRRRTAEHMVRSKATSPHTLVATEVDFENVEAVRRRHKDSFRAEEGVSLTYLPFIARALSEAVREFPHVNSSVGDDELIVHRDLHLGLAVDLQSEGLIVPVVHNADGKRLRALAREMADLAAKARARRLSADDIAGGTFTITNPGPFGTFLTVPIINQPQVAILSTDGVRRKPVVVTASDGSEAIAIHSVGLLALSFDHRAVDGAYAARFMAKLQSVIETWDWSQEL